MEKFYIGQEEKLATTINFTSETSHSFEKAHIILQGRKSSMVVRKKKGKVKITFLWEMVMYYFQNIT